MIVSSSIFLLLAGLLHTSSGKIPSYIKVCKLSDPKIEKCIINSVISLKPTLIKGIPELNVPSLDPLLIDKIDVSRGSIKGVGTNLVVKGASNFQIVDLKADVDNMKFTFKVTIPYINIDARYNVDMKLLSMVLKGEGPLQSNNTDITFSAILEGHKFQKGKATLIKFDSLKLDVVWKDYSVKLDNMFNGNKALGDAVNVALNENKQAMIELIKPIVEKVLSEKFLGIANSITKNFTFEELFKKD